MTTELQIASTAVGLLGVFAGGVAMWVKQQTKIKRLEDQVQQQQTRHESCSKLQADRYQDFIEKLHETDTHILQRIAEIDAKVAVTIQKLNDLVEWYKNGGPKRA
jgi:uncharacterized protein (DUF4415 family)